MDPIHWKRVQRALLQYARVHEISKRCVNRVMRVLPQLISMCGSHTQSRRVAYRIGKALLQPHPQVYVLCCPDYTHHAGRFTYKGLSDGVPMLVSRHTAFMRRVCALIPNLGVTFLIADQEANIIPLCKILGVTPTEFRDRVTGSILAARRRVARYGWEVRGFTQEMTNFVAQERRIVKELKADPRLRQRFEHETSVRARFFQKVGYENPALWRDRTYHIVAQYLVAGQYVASRNGLACNHSTPSLAWFLRTKTAFLENPIKIY